MENKESAKELERRTREFALQIIRLSRSLPNTVEGRVVRNQITKSGTSIGANYREANRDRSRADFKNKIDIAPYFLNFNSFNGFNYIELETTLLE